MHAAPTQELVEAHIEGLRFSMENRGQKMCSVLCEPKISDLETQLCLSYYAVNLSSVLFHEGFIAQIIKNQL